MTALACGLVVAAVPAASALTICSPSSCLTSNDDNYKTPFNTKLIVGAAKGLLANDTGPAGTIVDLFSSDTTSWNGAALVLHTDGSFTYTPDPSNPFSGIDSFDYWTTDAQGDSSFATAYIEIDAIATDDAYYAHVNQTLSVPAPGVFANDLALDPFFSSADASSAQGGDVNFNDDGSFDYTPPQDFSGADSFTYSAPDLNGDFTYTATVHIQVDSTPPVVWLTAPAAVTLSTKIPVKWSGADTSGIAHYDVQRTAATWNAGFQGYANWKLATTTASSIGSGLTGRTYCYRVRAEDRAGNTSGWAQRCTAVPLTSAGLTYSTGWTTHLSTAFYGGAARRSTTKGTKFTRTSIQAKHLYLVATKCSSCGTIQVRWNNVVTANVNLYRSSTAYHQVIPIASFPSVKAGTLAVIVTSPTGKQVVVEGLAVLHA